MLFPWQLHIMITPTDFLLLSVILVSDSDGAEEYISFTPFDAHHQPKVNNVLILHTLRKCSSQHFGEFTCRAGQSGGRKISATDAQRKLQRVNTHCQHKVTGAHPAPALLLPLAGITAGGEVGGHGTTGECMTCVQGGASVLPMETGLEVLPPPSSSPALCS